ncbi:MAG: hypothetical protein KGY38_00390 [Desulfobacterales bacterium]|nr:hypothetical protein [Desulfobacterales bacterium]
MEAKDYCNSMAAELTAWKAKLFDVISRTDKMGTAEKDKVWEYFNEMKIVIQDLEDKIESLRTECPADWSPQKKEIEDAHVDMRSKYEETLQYIGKASPISVPG